MASESEANWAIPVAAISAVLGTMILMPVRIDGQMELIATQLPNLGVAVAITFVAYGLLNGGMVIVIQCTSVAVPRSI